jgi:hypothetical protein
VAETLVVGDVHGCRRELERLAAKAGVKRVVLVGDLFLKGPDPRGVYDLVREKDWEAVLGNHDLRLLRYLEGGRRRDREARKCIRALDKGGKSWRKWLKRLPLFVKVRPFTVVHAGLHPSGSLKKTTRWMATTMRRWPKESANCQLWHEVYRADRRVVFGHDARRGLIRYERKGEPWLIGLDTGCVYGGCLSGYLVRADHIVQVRAKRVYRPIN